LTYRDITDFGAIGNGRTSCTEAINEAIRQVSGGEGGTVRVPAGVYITGTVFLESNLRLELAPGAVLLASEDPGDYPDIPRKPTFPPHLNRGQEMQHHLLYAEGLQNVTICGSGAIDGNVQAFTPNWDTKKPYTWTGASQRPFVPTIEISNCQDVRLEDVTIRNSPGWTCHLVCCDRVWITRVRLQNYVFAGNSDGFDVDGCRDVFFTNCHITTGDDAIVLKSFPNTRSCERICITGCIMETLCAALKIGTETWHDFRQIVFTDSIVTRSNRAFQITVLDGATVEDVTVRGLVVDTNSSNLFNRPIQIDLWRRHRGYLPGVTEDDVPPMGRVRRISMSDLTLRTDGRILLSAAPGRMLEDISLRDIRIAMPWIEDPAELPDDADPLQGSASCPEMRKARAAISAENIDGFLVENVNIAWPADPPGEDFQPKYKNGELIRDPRKDFEPVPPMSVLWGKNLRRAAIRPGQAASFRDAEDLRLDGCDLL
jgi:Glycosyl hydrolases family 28